MIEIKDLLARFSNILLSEEVKTESVRNIISQVIGLQIQKEDIKIKNSTVYLNIPPIYKNEVFLHQEKIIEMLGETLGKKAPKNIR